MAEPITRVTLFVPGAPAMAKRKLGENVRTRWIENDSHFGEAFAFGTVDRATVKVIDAAPGALVLDWLIDLREGRKEIVRAVKKLGDAGALAVRVEESKLGWDVATWLELVSSDDPWSWHRAVVAYLAGEKTMQSCGMHAFSLPDAEIAVGGDASAAQELASTFNAYQLAEEPDLQSGHTFSPDHETPRRRIERWPDMQYASDHPCHNPYGVWRIGPPGGKARATGDLVMHFVIALRVTLGLLEDKKGKPLTKKEVLAARDSAVCVALEPGAARAAERSRGYADLDPELVWEQWQLVRNRGR